MGCETDEMKNPMVDRSLMTLIMSKGCEDGSPPEREQAEKVLTFEVSNE